MLYSLLLTLVFAMFTTTDALAATTLTRHPALKQQSDWFDLAVRQNRMAPMRKAVLNVVAPKAAKVEANSSPTITELCDARAQQQSALNQRFQQEFGSPTGWF